MFKNLHLWANIMLGMVLAIALALGGLTWGSLRNLHKVMLDAERSELEGLAQAILVSVAAESRMAEAMSALVASLPDVQKYLAAGDRAGLEAALVPAFQILAVDYGVVQFQFHTPAARSFLRLHQPEKFGDDLSSFRHSVVDTNSKLEPHRGLEIGVAGLGARGMVPVFHDGQHVGSVELGMSFGPPFFDAFKATHGADAALLWLRDGKLETFASTFGEADPLLDEETLRAALAGQPQVRQVTVDGRSMLILAQLVQDYSGQPLGVLEVAKDRLRHQRVLADATNHAWLVAGLAMLFCLLVAQLTARSLGGRIRILAAGVDRVAAGDLSRDIPAGGKDELAALARAANAMRHRLNELVAEVRDNASSALAAAGEIARSVDGQAATSSEMSASVAEITSTMEELSASSTQIAEYSETVVDVARRTLEDSRGGSEAMQRLLSRMGEISRDNKDALAEIVDLGNKSKEISRIMDIINTVADQTKLIAFNAALEASSAGEAGKRFGVVAAEIRRLADSVTESTSEIATRVGQIQSSIGRLVVTSEKGAASVRLGMEESSQTSELLAAMVEGAAETTGAAQQISLSSQQQKTASDQVVVALREIVTASADTAQSVRRIATIAQDMTALSARLKDGVDSFTLKRRPSIGVPRADQDP